MKKALNKILLAVIAVLLAVIAYMGFTSQKKNTVDAVVLQNQVNNISELTTVEYDYTNMAKYENHSEFYGYKIPFTTNKFIISYDGTIKAGFDMSKAVIEVNDNKVTVTLPQAAVLSHTIDYDTMEIIDESYSIFNKLVISDYNQFAADQNKIMEQKAIDRGLLKKAKENAQNVLKTMISAIVPDYEIIIK